jgi:signal transduction histidine kinase
VGSFRDYLRRRFAGATGLGAFLVANLALSAWLGFQALTAAASHERAVESVLTDYSLQSATEFAGAVEDGLDDLVEDVFENVLDHLRDRGDWDSNEPWQPLSADSVREALEDEARSERCCPGLANPIAVLRVDGLTGATEVIPDTLSLATVDGIVQRVLPHQPDPDSRTEMGLMVDGSALMGHPVAIGYMVRLDTLRATEAAYAFVVSDADMRELFREWYDDEELVPEVIVGDDVPNDSLLYVTVSGPAGATFFASSNDYSFPAMARAPVDVADLSVQVAVRPDAVPRFVIGGLPRSRAGLLWLMLVLTLGVGLAAFIQLRREQSFQRLRDDFVSGVSHELRTPLAQIRMFAELQDTGRLRNPEDQKRATSVIHREARRLSHLVENILQFSRLQRTHGEGMPREDLDVTEALNEGLDAVTPLLEDRGMKLDFKAQRGLFVYANREALTRIIVNLVDNAVKYGPRGQTVRVSVGRANGSAVVSVADQGAGVPEADRGRIFKPYTRLERDVKAQITGTGIGLSVVSELASLHEGRAWVEDAPGGGARFVVELPLSDPEDEEAPIPVDAGRQPLQLGRPAQ